MRIVFISLALFLVNDCQADVTARLLRPNEEICQFYRAFGIVSDGTVLLRPEQDFLYDPDLDIGELILVDMAMRGRLEMKKLRDLNLIVVKRSIKNVGNHTNDLDKNRLGAVSAAFCFEQSKYPNKHRAAMGLYERENLGWTHRRASAWGVPAKFLMDPPPAVYISRNPDINDALRISAGEAWLRENDPENARLTIDQRTSWDYKLFYKKHVVCGNEQTVIAINIIPPVVNK